jgi:hypothetical protein
MTTAHTLETPPKAHGPTHQDVIFLIFLGLVVISVVLLGIKNFEEAVKVEKSKQNGEAWMQAMSDLTIKRFDEDFNLDACRGGMPSPAQSLGKHKKSEDTFTPGTWGACYQYFITQTGLKDLRNPFFNELPKIVQCSTADRSSIGGIMIENLMPTPPGSATPFVAKPLIASDPIDYKLQIRLSVCDKGGDTIEIGEFEF